MQKSKKLFVFVLLVGLCFFVSCSLDTDDVTAKIDQSSIYSGDEFLPDSDDSRAPSGIAYDVYYKSYSSEGTTSSSFPWYSGTDGDTVGLISNYWYLMGFAVDIRSLGFDVEYRTHFGSGHDWKPWSRNGSYTPMFSGNAVKKLQIRLVNASSAYHIEYRIHVQHDGWQGWVKDGQTAEKTYLFGTSRRKINGLQVKLTGPKKTQCSAIGSYDGANCYVGTAPSGSSAFIYNDNFYYTPVSGQCPYPGSYYDGANCFVADIPSGAHPFIWNNRWYVNPTY